MLEKAGLQVSAVYGGLVGDVLTRDGMGTALVAQKRAASS